MSSKTNKKPAYIGSFVLETLTTGMYGESRNALREYVQNAFDAVRAGIAAGVLRDRAAKIEVLLKDADTLVVHDNGIGIGASSAWETLTAIGASKKDRARDAGFRGIGRLAGIAFCDTLSFRTKAAGETTETTVTFDCSELRKGMAPESGGGKQLVDLLDLAVTSNTKEVPVEDDHYMEVTLSGLSRAPTEFKDLEEIRDYLAETAPVGFDPKWEWGKRIKGYGEKLDRPLEVTKILVGTTSEDAKQIYKLYRDAYPTKGEAVVLTDVEFHQREKWWAWIGIPDKAVSITDPLVHGIRIRVKNIQVGGANHLDAIFGRKGLSYIRFNKYYVGEIHVTPTALVPNARRDGFEDDWAWENIRDEFYSTFAKQLSAAAHKLSDDRQKSLETIEKKSEAIQDEFEGLDLKDPAKSEERAHLLSKTLKLRSQVTKAVARETEADARLQLRSHMQAMDNIKVKLGGHTGDGELKRIRASVKRELIQQILELIKPYLGPQDFAQVKKQIQDKVR